MKKFVNGMLLATMVMALALAGCEDDGLEIQPTTVTLSADGESTEFNVLAFVSYRPTTEIFPEGLGVTSLLIMGFNSTDTLAIIYFEIGQLTTDSPIALENPSVTIFGTLGGGEIHYSSTLGATGTMTFTRLDTLGFVSGEFSNNATLVGTAANGSGVTVTISGGFAAVGGNVDITDVLSKKLLLLPSAGGRLAVPFE